VDNYVQIYDGYDKAVIDLLHRRLRSPPAESGAPLLCVFATPERAFAQVWKRLESRKDDAQKTFPLSFASVDMTDADPDPPRDRPGDLRRFASYWDRQAGREVFVALPWPRPVTLTYQATFWTRDKIDLDDLLVQLLLLATVPGAGLYLSVQHPEPMGERLVYLRITGTERLSAIEAPDRQRMLRMVATLEIDGWIARPARPYGRVEKVTSELYESLDLESADHLLDRISMVNDVPLAASQMTPTWGTLTESQWEQLVEPQWTGLAET